MSCFRKMDVCITSISWRRKRAKTHVWRREVERLTRPAMGVWSLLIFFTDPGLIELNNLSHNDREENIWAKTDHKKTLRQSDIRARRRKWNCGCLFREKKTNKHREKTLRASHRGQWKDYDKTDSKLDLRFIASAFTHREPSTSSKTQSQPSLLVKTFLWCTHKGKHICWKSSAVVTELSPYLQP